MTCSRTVAALTNDATFCAIGRDVAPRLAAARAARPTAPLWWTRAGDVLAKFFTTPARGAASYV